jgi:hypothetical protein
MFGFFLPIATRGVFDPTTVIFVALGYAFIFVPLASGLVDVRPIHNFLLIFML